MNIPMTCLVCTIDTDPVHIVGPVHGTCTYIIVPMTVVTYMHICSSTYCRPFQKEFDDDVQIRPQKLKLKLRVGQ